MDFATLTRIAPEYVQNTLALHGDDGRRWLAGLGEQIAGCARRWNLRVGPPFPGLSYNFVNLHLGLLPGVQSATIPFNTPIFSLYPVLTRQSFRVEVKPA